MDPVSVSYQPPPLDLDALQAALTHLDHSCQKNKASLARSGTPRRPPSRSSRTSSRASKKSSYENLSILNLDNLNESYGKFPVFVNDRTDLIVPSPGYDNLSPGISVSSSDVNVFETRLKKSTISHNVLNQSLFSENVLSVSNSDSYIDKQDINELSPEKTFERLIEPLDINNTFVDKCKSVSGFSNQSYEIQTNSSRRSLPLSKERLIPITFESKPSGGIHVSVGGTAAPTKDGTRMYVKSSEIDNRPNRASAFNVRQTIEKRQLQQERRERKAIRKQIKEHLRSLSEGRKGNSSSESSHLSSSSNKSKSLSSLDQDSDENRSESPIFKVQSNPTLETEKESVRQYLFGSNLVDSSPVSAKLVARVMSPCSSRSNPVDIYINKVEPKISSEYLENKITNSDLKIPNSDLKEKYSPTSRSLDLLKNYDRTKRASITSSIISSKASPPVPNDKLSALIDINIEKTPSATSVISSSNVSSAFDRESYSSFKESASPVPTPPPRRNKIRRSTGQITLEQQEKPAWVRLAKERRSLREPSQVVEQLTEKTPSVVQEPLWVSNARKKLESLNVCITKTTDFNSISSQITESSSAWSRGGLDALQDLREETSRIGVELAQEAAIRVSEELNLPEKPESTKMLDYPKSRSHSSSPERPQRVSFGSDVSDNSRVSPSRGKLSRSNSKDEVRFGDLKHDWGGSNNNSSKSVNIQPKLNDQISQSSSPINRSESKREGSVEKSASNNLPKMHFGDRPLNMFTPPKSERKVFQSSKFESIPGPDPTTMTVEQLNQNVEEYDFPIPTGNEDATELLKALEESLMKCEVVPEVISEEAQKPKLKSILKRRSVENITSDGSDEIPNSTNKGKTSGSIPAKEQKAKTNSTNLNLNAESNALKRRFSVSEQNLSFQTNLNISESESISDVSEKEHHSLNLSQMNSVTQAAENFFKVKLKPIKGNKPNLNEKSDLKTESQDNISHPCISETNNDIDADNNSKVGIVERQKNMFENQFTQQFKVSKRLTSDDNINNNFEPDTNKVPWTDKSFISTNTFILKDEKKEHKMMKAPTSEKKMTATASWSTITCRNMNGISRTNSVTQASTNTPQLTSTSTKTDINSQQLTFNNTTNETSSEYETDDTLVGSSSFCPLEDSSDSLTETGDLEVENSQAKTLNKHQVNPDEPSHLRTESGRSKSDKKVEFRINKDSEQKKLIPPKINDHLIGFNKRITIRDSPNKTTSGKSFAKKKVCGMPNESQKPHSIGKPLNKYSIKVNEKNNSKNVDELKNKYMPANFQNINSSENIDSIVITYNSSNAENIQTENIQTSSIKTHICKNDPISENLAKASDLRLVPESSINLSGDNILSVNIKSKFNLKKVDSTEQKHTNCKSQYKSSIPSNKSIPDKIESNSNYSSEVENKAKPSEKASKENPPVKDSVGAFKRRESLNQKITETNNASTNIQLISDSPDTINMKTCCFADEKEIQPISFDTTPKPFNNDTSPPLRHVEVEDKPIKFHFGDDVDGNMGTKLPTHRAKVVISPNKPDRRDTTRHLTPKDSFSRNSSTNLDNKKNSPQMTTFSLITSPNDLKKKDPKVKLYRLVGNENSSSPAWEEVSQVETNQYPSIKPSIESTYKHNRSPSPPQYIKPVWVKTEAKFTINSDLPSACHDTENTKRNNKQLTSKSSSLNKRNSLTEWENLQRMKIEEDDHKIKPLKTFSIKPVSIKIKDLVNGNFKSFFSKDKKIDIKGTVDGKEDIVFQKNPITMKPELNNEYHDRYMNSDNHIKSPYIVQKLMQNSNSDTKLNKIINFENNKLSSEKHSFLNWDEEKSHHKVNSSIKELTSNKKYFSRTPLKNKNVISTHQTILNDTVDSSLRDEKINKLNVLVNNSKNITSTNNQERFPLKRNSLLKDTISQKKIDKIESKTERPANCLTSKSLNLSDENVPMIKNENKFLFNYNADDKKYQHFDSISKESDRSRGPVSLSSIIGDSSRTSSINSTPRASPERIIDILNNTNKDTTQKYSQKENIAPAFNRWDKLVSSNISKSFPGRIRNNSSESENLKSPSAVNLSTRLFGVPQPDSKTSKPKTHIFDYKGIQSTSFPSSYDNHDIIDNCDQDDSYDDNRFSFNIDSPILERRDSLTSNGSSIDSLKLSSLAQRRNNLLGSSYRRHKNKFSMSERNSSNNSSYKDINEITHKDSHSSSLPNILDQPAASKILFRKLEDIKKMRVEKESRFSTEYNKSSDNTKNKGETRPNFLFGIDNKVSDNKPGYTSKSNDTNPKIEPSIHVPIIKNESAIKDKSSKPVPQVRRKTSFKRQSSKSILKPTCDESLDKKRFKRSKENLDKRESSRRGSSSSRKGEETESVTVDTKNGQVRKNKVITRRCRLASESSDKGKQSDTGTSSRRGSQVSLKRVSSFKSAAKKDLEKWAKTTSVKGKLTNKAAERFTQECEEEIEDGKKTSKAVLHRVVRRGSRNLSTGGDLLTTSAETTTSNDPAANSTDNPLSVVPLAPPDKVKRKIKTTTDGERYMTESVDEREGKRTVTTEGVNNKTTKSVELIGGKNWEGERKVEGKAGETVTVQRNERGPTVVKKVTSHSRVTVTKTKKKPALK